MHANRLSAIPRRANLALFFGAVLVLLLALVALLPAMPVFYHMPDTDASIFLLIGNKIRQGQLPFRDWYDHKPPLIFYLNALGMWIGGGSRWGVWIVELLSLSTASMFGFAFLRRYYSTMTATLAMSAVLLNLTFVLQRGNLTEEYALPFQFGAIFLVSNIELPGRHIRSMLGVGALLALASSLKQPLAGAGFAIAACLLVFYASQERWRDLLRACMLILLGFTIVWAAWFLYFFAAGIFPEFWEAAFAYNVALSGITLQKRLMALVSGLQMLWGMSGFFLAGMLAWLAALPTLLRDDDRLARAFSSRPVGLLLAAAGLLLALLGFGRMQSLLPLMLVGALICLGAGLLIVSGWMGRRLNPVRIARLERASPLFLPLVIALVDFPVALVFSSLSGNNFVHYFMALLPSLALLTAFLIHSLMNLFRMNSGLPVGAAWLAALLLPVMIPGVLETADRTGPRGDRQLDAVIQYVEENTQPGDKVFQWGIVPQVNLLTGRDAPSRYFFPDPLFVDGYSGRVQTGELLHDFQANPPLLIIYEGIARLPLLMPGPGESCDVVRDPRTYERFVAYWKQRVDYSLPRMPEGMDEVYYWICQNYHPVGPVGELGWQVYRLKGK